MKTTKKAGDQWEIREIDIIAKFRTKIVFFEVKYRSSSKYWTAEESLTKYKLSKCKKTIDYYCKKNFVDFEKIRFDAITILKQEKSYKITHYKNIEI
jgi:putative endonuclease